MKQVIIEMKHQHRQQLKSSLGEAPDKSCSECEF